MSAASFVVPLLRAYNATIPQWFDDSEPAVAEAARGGVGLLSRLGAKVVAVTLPELEQLRVASSCIILTEMFGTTRSVYEDPQLRPQVGASRLTNSATQPLDIVLRPSGSPNGQRGTPPGSRPLVCCIPA
jgi:Asp-tRNA(Asn)/Glu-tRNA(Gln) amidotransferase A subunit family amidase